MIDKAEDLRDEYYLIKMTPRPKVKKVIPVQEEAKPADAQPEGGSEGESGESKE
jgi:hypothetical protein